MQQPVIIMMVPQNYQNAQLMHNYNGQLQYNLGGPGKVLLLSRRYLFQADRLIIEPNKYPSHTPSLQHVTFECHERVRYLSPDY